MSFKLTKAEHTQRDELVTKLNAVAEKIKEAVVEEYNGILTDARELASDIHSQADQDISDKSEKWQEGDRGQAAISFRDEWSAISLDDIEVEFPDELQIEEPEHADNLEQAPAEAES